MKPFPEGEVQRCPITPGPRTGVCSRSRPLLARTSCSLTSLVGEEAISELFSYEVDMLSTDHAISAESLIGDKVKLVITSEDGKTRPIHGMVAQWRAGPLINRELRQYRARLVPWLWYLGHTTDCRIFQNLNVPDIIEQVFKTFGFTDYQISVSRGDYPKLEFCVQYRETALNFVSRLMEEVGIFYFFRHDEGPARPGDRRQERDLQAHCRIQQLIYGRARRGRATSRNGNTATSSGRAAGRSATSISRRPPPT